jgi:hypothetical protein
MAGLPMSAIVPESAVVPPFDRKFRCLDLGFNDIFVETGREELEKERTSVLVRVRLLKQHHMIVK